MLRWEADEQCGQDPEREEQDGEKPIASRQRSGAGKEYRLSGAKGLGGLFKPGEKSASSREMSLFQRGLPWSAPRNLI